MSARPAPIGVPLSRSAAPSLAEEGLIAPISPFLPIRLERVSAGRGEGLRVPPQASSFEEALGPLMRESDHFLTFAYRYLDDGKVESTCMHCHTVVCCSDSADEVMKAQATHICEPNGIQEPSGLQ